MTEDDTQATVVDADGVDIEVASDPDESQTIVTGMTVSSEEQVSTGDYESFTPYVSRRVIFRPAIDVSDPAGRVRVRREAMNALADIQNDLNAAISARLADPDFVDWPTGVDTVDLDTGDSDD